MQRRDGKGISLELGLSTLVVSLRGQNVPQHTTEVSAIV